MSDDDILNASIQKHRSGDLSCVCSLVLDVEVLSADCYVRTLDCLYDRYDVDCRYAIYNVYIRIYYEILQGIY